MALKILPSHLHRYRQIAALLVRHGRGDLVRSAGIEGVLEEEAEVDPRAAERLADDLEAMGPTFVKLGQLMSSRVDLLSPAYTDALARLQDDLEPFPYAQVEEIVSTELGVRLSKAFPTFEEKPLAAASLGQVHRATLRSGDQVVVKVQRPGIRAQVLEDMELLTDLAEFLEGHTDLGRRFAVTELVEEFRKSLFDELDYRREADNLLTVGSVLQGNEQIVVPAPYGDLTTSRVLTMEYVEGRKVTDLGPLGRLELDGAPLADALFAAYLRQVLVEGVFHADPHPGNVLLTPDGRLVLLDIGMVARLAPPARDKLVKLLLALADRRPDEVARVARTMGKELPGYDDTVFERAVADVVGRATESSLAELDVGAMMLQLARKAAEAGLRMDPELAMLGKTMLNLDQVATTLDPDFDPREALHRHTSELMRTSMKVSPAAMLSSLLEAKEFAEALPGRVNRAFDAIGEGHFELRIKAFDEDEFLQGLHKLANVIAGGSILAAMILSSALLARSSGGEPTLENRIALAVFLVSIVIALAMLWRIASQSKRVRTRRRR
ncbi:MAG TPA: AarF/UbiB family protein [Nocardioidaceae bacterium]|jgi:predicted unusual protein kinase regulating ubiquinone biosynthesis (AarF/ABC1/UbiB family)